MAHQDLTPRGPAPEVDLSTLRDRVRERSAELRRRSLRRLRNGLITGTAVVLAATGSYVALRSPGPDHVAAESGPPIGEEGPGTTASASDCALGLEQTVSEDRAGLSITPDLEVDDAGKVDGTVTVANRGTDLVRISHSSPGLTVLALDDQGSQVTGSDISLLDLHVLELDVGEELSLPVFVHIRPCGGGGLPSSYVALVDYYRSDEDWGIARSAARPVD